MFLPRKTVKIHIHPSELPIPERNLLPLPARSTSCTMSSQYSSSSILANPSSQIVCSTQLAIPIYATIWILFWLLGMSLEFAVFVGKCLVQGESPSQGRLDVTLDMPVFALFCIALWLTVKLLAWSIVFLCSLLLMASEASDADEENARAARQRREQVLRRRAMRKTYQY